MAHAPGIVLGSALLLVVACGPRRADPLNPAPAGGEPAAADVEPGADVAAGEAAPAVGSIEELVRAVAAGTRPAADLEVVYDDMHPLHGGETITLRGDGTVTARRREPPETPQTEQATHATPEQVRDIVALLVEIEAWKQQVAERAMLPDESTASLRLSGDGAETMTWEFYNDLGGLDRLVRVKRALEALAFPAP